MYSRDTKFRVPRAREISRACGCTVLLYVRKFRDFSSLYLGKYCIFVCATLFLGIKLIEQKFRETKFHIQKYDGLENIYIEKRSRALEVTLSSSTDTNLGHNHTKI